MEREDPHADLMKDMGIPHRHAALDKGWSIKTLPEGTMAVPVDALHAYLVAELEAKGLELGRLVRAMEHSGVIAGERTAVVNACLRRANEAMDEIRAQVHASWVKAVSLEGG